MFQVGQTVKVSCGRRRPFVATIVNVRGDQEVDVKDPRNGGLRTLTVDHVRLVRKKSRPV